ncbi:hypothetical protein, partial [Dechloromonas sp.]|uniref:hypothetical protein n=1 Tax=Dechloromonas sp. TaxID=1917218 RepID=UPI00263F8847
CLPIEKTIRKQRVYQIDAVNQKTGRKNHGVRLCEMSCVERHAVNGQLPVIRCRRPQTSRRLEVGEEGAQEDSSNGLLGP